MKKFLHFGILVVVGLFSACGDSAKTTNTKPTSTAKSASGSPQKVLERKKANPDVKSNVGRDYTYKRGSALSIMNHRMEADSEVYSILEDGVWEYKFVHNGEAMSKSGDFNGYWLDFKNDHTYSFGKYDKVEGTGKYHFNFEKELVLMLPDDKSKNPEEWDLKFGTDVLIMIGTAEYGNNYVQQKLIRKKDIASLTK